MDVLHRHLSLGGLFRSHADSAGNAALPHDDRKEEAFTLLARISGRQSAGLAIAEMQAAVHKGGGWQALRRPGVKRALRVSFFLAILIHVSGINTVVDYAP